MEHIVFIDRGTIAPQIRMGTPSFPHTMQDYDQSLPEQVVERARERGEVHPDAGALPTAQLFMVGLYAMLIASHEYPKAARAEILDNFMATVLRGVAPR